MLSNEIQYDEYCKTRFSLQENSSLRDHLLLLLSCSGWESIFSWTKNYWLVCYNWVERNFTAEGLDSTLASAKNKKTSLKLHRSCSLSLFFFPLHTCHMSPGQGSNPRRSCNPCHSCGEAESLTHCTRLGMELCCCRGNTRSLTHCTAEGTPWLLKKSNFGDAFVLIFYLSLAINY